MTIRTHDLAIKYIAKILREIFMPLQASWILARSGGEMICVFLRYLKRIIDVAKFLPQPSIPRVQHWLF